MYTRDYALFMAMGATVVKVEQDMIEALRRAGTPATVLAPIETLVRQRDQARGEQYRTEEWRRIEIDKADSAAADELRAEIARAETEAAAQRDSELTAIDREILQTQLLPTKQLSDTDAEYSAKLTTRQIQETRDLAALTASQTDVTLALATDDVDTLEQLVAEALDAGHPERVRRVARAVELQLAKLATAEVANGSQLRHARDASQRVTEQLRAWRAGEAAKSPAVRRQQIESRFKTRVQDARTTIGRAASAFRLNGFAAPSPDEASLEAARAQRQPGGIVIGEHYNT